jgi:hypothetical protein
LWQEEWRRRESRGRKNEEQEQRGKGKLITDTNKDILFGKKPFEFRILEAPKPDAFDGMSCKYFFSLKFQNFSSFERYFLYLPFPLSSPHKSGISTREPK